MHIYSFIFAKRETSVGLQPTKLRLRVLISELPSKFITNFNRIFVNFQKKMPKLCVFPSTALWFWNWFININTMWHQFSTTSLFIRCWFAEAVGCASICIYHSNNFYAFSKLSIFNAQIKKIDLHKNRWMETQLALAEPSACPAASRPPPAAACSPPSALGVVCLSLLRLVGH